MRNSWCERCASKRSSKLSDLEDHIPPATGSSRMRRDPESNAPAPAVISVVMPYYRRGEIFDRCLDAVLRQDHPHTEVIVVDNHSEDGVADRIAGKSADVKLICMPENGGACSARNAGIAAAAGDIIVLLDDDMELAQSD